MLLELKMLKEQFLPRAANLDSTDYSQAREQY
jgi:hypothetical protein